MKIFGSKTPSTITYKFNFVTTNNEMSSLIMLSFVRNILINEILRYSRTLELMKLDIMLEWIKV